MTTIAANLSVSVDGFYVGPDAGPDRPLGRGGEALHSWFAHQTADRAELTTDEVLRPEFERAGAMLMGRDCYDDAQAAWGPHPPFENPIVVLTHRPRPDDVRDGTTFTFVADGFDAGLARAHDAAGGRDVMLHGGGAIRQALATEVLDELQLHVVPVLLGGGRWLFADLGDLPRTLEPVRTLVGVGVTHLRYRCR